MAPVPVRLTTPEDNTLIPINNNGSGPPSASKVQQLQLKAIQRPKLSGHHPKVSTSTIAPPPVTRSMLTYYVYVEYRIIPAAHLLM